MSDKHLSTQYDAELSAISNQVLQMGGLAESQVIRAVECLTQLQADVAEDVLVQEARVNQLEMDIDSEISAIIARRQPTARDLRLLVAISKMIANLERVGDEAARIARTAKRLIESGVSSRLPIHDLAHEAELGIAQLRQPRRGWELAGFRFWCLWCCCWFPLALGQALLGQAPVARFGALVEHGAVGQFRLPWLSQAVQMDVANEQLQALIE